MTRTELRRAFWGASDAAPEALSLIRERYPNGCTLAEALALADSEPGRAIITPGQVEQWARRRARKVTGHLPDCACARCALIRVRIKRAYRVLTA